MREVLLAEFDHEVASTLRVLAAVPTTQFAWTPQDGMRSFAALAAHLTQVLGWGATILDETTADISVAAAVAPASVATPADAVRAFRDEAARVRTRLDRSDGELLVSWTLTDAEELLFQMPRAAAFRSFVLSHLVHHRGQLTVYLRLVGGNVPPVYGPTGDARRQ